MSLLAVILIRSPTDRRPEERKTLELLKLNKKFNCVIVPDTLSIRGMLKVLENVVTYGEIDKNILVALIEKRGRLDGNKKIQSDYLKKLGYDNFEKLAEALLSGTASLDKLPSFKPVFRLHPPKGGFKRTIKKHYNDGGELGYRGYKINELLLTMI
ncbi:MAG: 50S ribosomal protein L30 [Thermofilaceae archaeon]